MQVLNIDRASTHNLKQVSVSLPKSQLIVFTGRSGSGKSSLAFDTLYAEGQRRYVESLSPYARQFLSLMPKPEVGSITGLSPAIAIDQKSVSHNPRSTVGTLTEIHDYLRLLFAKLGQANCPEHDLPLCSSTLSEIREQLLKIPEQSWLYLYAPLLPSIDQEMKDFLKKLWKEGYLRVRMAGELHDLAPLISAASPIERQPIAVLIDRLVIKPRIEERIYDSVETALRLSEGRLLAEIFPHAPSIAELSACAQRLYFSLQPTCAICDYQIPSLTPQQFSFNHPKGACSDCDGLGVKNVLDPRKLIPFPDLPLLSGGLVAELGNRDRLHQQLQAIAEACEFDLNASFSELNAIQQSVLLYGTRSGVSPTELSDHHYFPGLIAQTEARYAQAKFAVTKERLARLFSSARCPTCHGTRLNAVTNLVRVNGVTLAQLCDQNIEESYAFLADWEHWSPPSSHQIAAPILREILSRLSFLKEVGLNYLTLARSAASLSGGESQRIRLASQIGSGLTGVLYVLDEPSIGLHASDNQKLLRSLRKLTDLGNTLVVVEHDEQTLLSADYLVELGPGAGKLGGEIVAQGKVSQLMKHPRSETGAYLSGRKQVHAISESRGAGEQWLNLQHVCTNNLQNVDLSIPVGCLIGITGVSGSGKSSLINRSLLPVMLRALNQTDVAIDCAVSDEQGVLSGAEHFDKLIVVNQAPIGRTPRSNAATYTGLFTDIRSLYAKTALSRALGYDASRFSFNLPGGRCEACQGEGVNRVTMHFLPDVEVKCEICNGRRYNPPTLEVIYKGMSIDGVLSLSAEEAQQHFTDIPKIHKKLATLVEAGLGYLPIGQSATQLSGGEAQRVKLAKELAKRGTGRTLYLLDEPTTGLHYFDIQNLVNILFKLRDQGNTIVVIEHNLEVVSLCDWIVDLGPSGGKAGGKIVAAGTPESIAKQAETATAKALAAFFRDRDARFQLYAS